MDLFNWKNIIKSAVVPTVLILLGTVNHSNASSTIPNSAWGSGTTPSISLAAHALQNPIFAKEHCPKIWRQWMQKLDALNTVSVLVTLSNTLGSGNPPCQNVLKDSIAQETKTPPEPGKDHRYWYIQLIQNPLSLNRKELISFLKRDPLFSQGLFFEDATKNQQATLRSLLCRPLGAALTQGIPDFHARFILQGESIKSDVFLPTCIEKAMRHRFITGIHEGVQ